MSAPTHSTPRPRQFIIADKLWNKACVFRAGISGREHKNPLEEGLSVLIDTGCSMGAISPRLALKLEEHGVIPTTYCWFATAEHEPERRGLIAARIYLHSNEKPSLGLIRAVNLAVAEGPLTHDILLGVESLTSSIFKLDAHNDTWELKFKINSECRVVFSTTNSDPLDLKWLHRAQYTQLEE